MALQWYFMKNGQQFGPLSVVELKRKADSGELGPDDPVRPEDHQRWVKAAAVKGLLAALTSPLPPPSPSTPPPLPTSSVPLPTGSEDLQSEFSNSGNDPHDSVRPFGEWYQASWLSQKSRRGQVIVWAALGFVWIPYWYFWMATPTGSIRGKWASLGLGGKAGCVLLTGFVCLLAMRIFVHLPQGNDHVPYTQASSVVAPSSPVTSPQNDKQVTPLSDQNARRPITAKDTPLSSVSGRHLTVNVKNTGIIDASLTSVQCVATEDRLVIDFDFDASKWAAIHQKFPILVQLFDKNGQYLTHFTTAEGFTAFSDVCDWYDEVVQTYTKHGQVAEAAKNKCILLKPKGNRLIYGVNIRDLRDASIVEIGFAER